MDSLLKMGGRVASRLYDAMGLKPRPQSESMSKSKHDHAEGGYTTTGEPVAVAVDQSYISWLVSTHSLLLILAFGYQKGYSCSVATDARFYSMIKMHTFRASNEPNVRRTVQWEVAVAVDQSYISLCSFVFINIRFCSLPKINKKTQTSSFP
ncbi:hypothetical protein HanRHA438_Chr13g0585641 [Helianthus annuus]|nr:hypothetical protein HanRHA438_Chr13g0585641 [Helianthus annuus]